MCTMIARKVAMEGSGKNSEDWFRVNQANVAYDHPYHVFREHSLNIDFVNEADGPGARVAVELSVESARNLVDTILNVLNEAERGGWVDEGRRAGSPHARGQELGNPVDRGVGNVFLGVSLQARGGHRGLTPQRSLFYVRAGTAAVSVTGKP